MVLSRREILGSAVAVGGWLVLGSDQALAQQAASQPAAAGAGSPGGPYQLPPLPYDYADLEPHIDAQTMKLHHDIHHAAYVRGANVAIAELERIRREGGNSVAQIRAVTDALSFNAAGHVLHVIFWNNMKKDGGGDPAAGSEIQKLIVRDFGSVEAFRGHFQSAAMQVQGSGWAILAWEPFSQRLIILQSEKHNSLTVWGAMPLLVVDVWEHAYYLKYQNKRNEYIKAFGNVINWDDVNRRLIAAMKTVVV